MPETVVPEKWDLGQGTYARPFFNTDDDGLTTMGYSFEYSGEKHGQYFVIKGPDEVDDDLWLVAQIAALRAIVHVDSHNEVASGLDWPDDEDP
ncbi:MAG: hypothetical protein V3R83_10950, partial [Gammaproteobacteria bacterium]